MPPDDTSLIDELAQIVGPENVHKALLRPPSPPVEAPPPPQAQMPVLAPPAANLGQPQPQGGPSQQDYARAALEAMMQPQQPKQQSWGDIGKGLIAPLAIGVLGSLYAKGRGHSGSAYEGGMLALQTWMQQRQQQVQQQLAQQQRGTAMANVLARLGHEQTLAQHYQQQQQLGERGLYLTQLKTAETGRHDIATEQRDLAKQRETTRHQATMEGLKAADIKVKGTHYGDLANHYVRQDRLRAHDLDIKAQHYSSEAGQKKRDADIRSGHYVVLEALRSHDLDLKDKGLDIRADDLTRKKAHDIVSETLKAHEDEIRAKHYDSQDAAAERRNGLVEARDKARNFIEQNKLQLLNRDQDRKETETGIKERHALLGEREFAERTRQFGVTEARKQAADATRAIHNERTENYQNRIATLREAANKSHNRLYDVQADKIENQMREQQSEFNAREPLAKELDAKGNTALAQAVRAGTPLGSIVNSLKPGTVKWKQDKVWNPETGFNETRWVTEDDLAKARERGEVKIGANPKREQAAITLKTAQAALQTVEDDLKGALAQTTATGRLQWFSYRWLGGIGLSQEQLQRITDIKSAFQQLSAMSVSTTGSRAYALLSQLTPHFPDPSDLNKTVLEKVDRLRLGMDLVANSMGFTGGVRDKVRTADIVKRLGLGNMNDEEFGKRAAQFVLSQPSTVGGPQSPLPNKGIGAIVE